MSNTPIELTTKKPTADVEMVTLFSLDGEEYKIPRKPKLNLALKTMKIMRTQGADSAGAYMLEELLGDEAYDALCEYEDLDQETLAAIMKAAQTVVFGGLEAPKES